LLIDSAKFFPDGVSYWDKQEDIHKNAHAGGGDVHGGPAFIPWHRELVNRLEALLREVDPALSLHYWDWTTDPRATPDGAGGTIDLFTPEFMGGTGNPAGPPFAGFESTQPGSPVIERDVAGGAPPVVAPPVTSDAAVLASPDFPTFDANSHPSHDAVHGYIGGTIALEHYSFHDPFVFLLHSDLDRLWAAWQSDPAHPERLDPNQVYGAAGAAPSINEDIQPYAGDVGTGVAPLRPWAPPDNQQVVKTYKDPSVVFPRIYDASSQDNWRWCNKCQGLFFAGNPGSVCPADHGAHDSTGSGDYSLVQNSSLFPGQDNWRWCNKCQGLFFAGNPGSVCPADHGAHDSTGSGDYSLVQNQPSFAGQDNWRWCNKCQGLFFAGNPGSVCPADMAAHDSTGSGDYSLVQNWSFFPGQDNWRWCNKCEGLFFAGNPGSVCPADHATHDSTGSGDYTLLNNFAEAPGQHDWRWCNKCQGLFFAGNPGSVCPADKAAHDSTGSGDYSLLGA
jgi:predicted chitinase